MYTYTYLHTHREKNKNHPSFYLLPPRPLVYTYNIMARLFSTTRFATALLLVALPGWTIGAGELLQALANAANTDTTNTLGGALAQAVSSNAGSLTTTAGAALATNTLGVTAEELGTEALNNPNPTAGVSGL